VGPRFAPAEGRRAHIAITSYLGRIGGGTNCPAGLVINFSMPRLMDGVSRLLLKDRFAKQPGETS